jgi:hypothetical protein
MSREPAHEPVKWGIVSTADINRAVIPPAQASEKCDLIAVASRDSARAEAYAREWGIERSYGSYEALLEDADVEGGLHLPAELDALRVVDPSRRSGKARALREAAVAPGFGGGGGLRRSRPGRAPAVGGVHVATQPADPAS